METGLSRSGPGTEKAEKAVKEAAEALADLKLENRELKHRLQIEPQDGPDQRRMLYPPGDWDWEVIRTDPLDHGRPGPPLLRDYGRGRGRGAPHRQRR